MKAERRATGLDALQYGYAFTAGGWFGIESLSHVTESQGLDLSRGQLICLNTPPHRKEMKLIIDISVAVVLALHLLCHRPIYCHKRPVPSLLGPSSRPSYSSASASASASSSGRYWNRGKGGYGYSRGRRWRGGA